jgi:hypothetical protein
MIAGRRFRLLDLIGYDLSSIFARLNKTISTRAFLHGGRIKI